MKTINDQQFHVAKENITDIVLLLIENSFEELDACISEFAEDAILFIDSKSKTYYFLDQECLTSSAEIVKHKFNMTVEPVTIEQIRSWT
jgi:hypothetical protein